MIAYSDFGLDVIRTKGAPLCVRATTTVPLCSPVCTRGAVVKIANLEIK